MPRGASVSPRLAWRGMNEPGDTSVAIGPVCSEGSARVTVPLSRKEEPSGSRGWWRAAPEEAGGPYRGGCWVWQERRTQSCQA